MRALFSVAAAGLATAFLVPPTAPVQAQSISPESVTATMSVGETLTINKTITLGESGANLVDIFFLADNTGSMGGVVNAAKSGAGAILGAVPGGADYNFGVGRYYGDPSEFGVSPSDAYQELTALTDDNTAITSGINAWNASGGGDYPEANFFALEQSSSTVSWRTGSQRLLIWFGDAPSHTATTTEAEAIAALNAAGVKVIAFNSSIDGFGLDSGNQASNVAAATDGTITHNFNTLSGSDFATAVNGEISAATSSLDLVFGSTLVGSGLNLTFACTDDDGCNDVGAGESRTFDLTIEAVEVGTYDFSVFAEGVSATERDLITVVDATVPEPATLALLGTGLLAFVFLGLRRREEAESL